MKSIILSLFPLSALLVGVSINSASATDLTIYTYESFNSEWGPGPVVFKSRCDNRPVYGWTDAGHYQFYGTSVSSSACRFL